MKGMNNRSLRLHLTITFAIVALIPILVLGSFQVRQIRQITNDYNDTQMQAAFRLADAVQTYIYYYRNAVETLATTISASGTSFRNREGLTVKLQSVKDTLPGFKGLYVADEHGIVTALYPDPERDPRSTSLPSVLGADLTKRSFYEKMLADQSTIISSLYLGPEGGDTPVLAIATPVYSLEKRYDGFVLGVLDLKDIETLVTKYDYGPGSYPVVLDTEGRAVYHPNREIITSLKDLSGEAIVQDRKMNGQGLGKYESDVFKQDELVAYTTIPDLGWTVWVSRSYEVANAAFLSSLRTTFLLLVLTLALAIIVGTLLAKRLNNTIHLLVDYTQKLANGILGESSSPIASKSAPYELQMLADQFFRMAKQLTSNQRALLALNSELESRVAERTQSLSRTNQELEIVNTLLIPAADYRTTNSFIERSIVLLRELTPVGVRLHLFPHTGSSSLGNFKGWEGMIVPSPHESQHGAQPDLVIPVSSGSSKLGELIVGSKPEMTEADRKFLHTFANTIAVILQNDILLSSIRHEGATLNAVLESMSDAIVLIDTEQDVVYANRRMSEMFHIPLQELLKMTEHSLFAAVIGSRPDNQELFREWSRKHSGAVKFKLFTAQGKERYILLSSFEVSGENTVFGRGYVWRDITKEHEIDSLKNDLISLASHEFKTPITSIKGGVETLLRSDTEWEESFKRELLEGIHEDIGRIQGLIDDWLDISKIEAGAMRIERQPLRVSAVLEAAIGRLPKTSEETTFDVSLAPDLPLIYADKLRLEQVFVNLFNNAVRYNDNSPLIRVTAEADRYFVIIHVSDNGIGIPSEHLEHIFDRFYRVDISSSRQTGGTGLGLAICAGIIEAHGGEIRVTSVQGEGSTFSLFIPRFQIEDGDDRETTENSNSR